MIGGLQVNDTPMPSHEMAQLGYVPMSDRIVPGEGEFPLAEVLAIILAGSDRPRVGIEVFSSRLRAMAPEEAAALVHRAVGDRLSCIFVDHGLLRLH